MPRDANNIYIQPSGTRADPGTLIESGKFNQLVDDLIQDLNTPRPIVAGGTGENSLGNLWDQIKIIADDETAGIVELATSAEALAGSDNTKAVTPAGVKAAFAALVNGAPGALDTLKELADAIGDDPNFAATIAAQIGTKAPLASPALTGNPTAPTQSAGNNSTRLATTAFVTAAVAAAVLTAAQILTALKTVDGAGSGLDADLLDGNQASAFAAANHNHSASDITSGTLAVARIPGLPATQITSGALAIGRGGTGNTSAAAALAGLGGAGYYDGSSSGNTSFPIGQYILTLCDDRPTRRASVDVGVDGSDSGFYNTGVSDLSGTWRSCGGTYSIDGKNYALVNRTA